MASFLDIPPFVLIPVMVEIYLRQQRITPLVSALGQPLGRLGHIFGHARLAVRQRFVQRAMPVQVVIIVSVAQIIIKLLVTLLAPFTQIKESGRIPPQSDQRHAIVMNIVPALRVKFHGTLEKLLCRFAFPRFIMVNANLVEQVICGKDRLATGTFHVVHGIVPPVFGQQSQCASPVYRPVPAFQVTLGQSQTTNKTFIPERFQNLAHPFQALVIPHVEHSRNGICQSRIPRTELREAFTQTGVTPRICPELLCPAFPH